jgi:ribonucleoside-diphosphate reductase alpha subunit
MDFYVTKRNGRSESVDFSKILRRLSFLSSDLKNVCTSVIARDVISNINNGIQTTELDKIAAQKSYSKITEHPEYGVFAARIIIDDHQKNTKGDFQTKMKLLYGDGTLAGDFMKRVEKLPANEINHIIDYKRDFLIDYFGFLTLYKKYLLKSNFVVVERPQDLFMRVAIQLSMNINDPDLQLEFIRNNYNYFSRGLFTQATPTLFNAGLKNKQFSSCVLLTVGDSAEEILHALSNCGIMSKYSFGIGASFSHIRSKDEPIYGTNGKSKGTMVFCNLADHMMEIFDQGGGRRPGSMSIYMEMHHPDLLEFISIRKPLPNRKLIEHVFPALWVSDLFMKRVEGDGVWSFFDSYKFDVLNNVYGKEYEKIYIDLEEKKLFKKQMRARDIFNEIYLAACQTGTPYFLFKDSVNRRNNQSNVGMIKCSNLCCEIVEYSSPTSYSSCNLASLCLPKFVKDMLFVSKNNDDFPESPYVDWDELRECVHQLVENLNNLIDLTWAPCEEISGNNENLRPIGIGVQGLSDVFFKFRFPFESKDACKLNREIFERIYFYALEKSNEMAKSHGPYSRFKGSPLSEGKFQFDLYDSFDYSTLFLGKEKWNCLRSKIMKYGVYNSLLLACMPTASTSQIQGNTEGIDPLTSNIYKRETMAGEFIVVNKYLINELHRIGLWNSDVRKQIEKRGGSIQGISEIPEFIRNIYKTVWEIKQRAVIDMAADRQLFVDQTQSMNLHFETLKLSQFYSALMYGWKSQLKTGYYYMRTKPVRTDTPVYVCNEEVCESCQA